MRWTVLVTVVFSSHFIAASAAYGQAWVPQKQGGRVSISYRNLFVKDHTTDTGARFDGGEIYQSVIMMDLDYGLSRRIAVNFALPLIFGRYVGNRPHRHEGQVEYMDDGGFHGGTQDFRLGLRYNAVRWEEPFVITPFVDVIIPTRDYSTFGHALIGRNLRELMVGTYVGREGFGSLLPNAYFQTRVSYAFVERVLDISHNRTNIDVEIGHPLTDRVGLLGLASFQWHYGGLVWIPDFEEYSHEEWHNHGQLFKNNALDVGGGVSFQLNPTTRVFTTFVKTPWSRNAHALNRGLIIGISRSFDTVRRPPLR
jgi:hypothetical protein